MADRAEAQQRDAIDPLRGFQDRFVPAPDGLIYLDGNSLGRLPRDTPAAIADVVAQQWGERLIRGWEDGWMALPGAIGARLGEHLLGAAPGQTVMADSTTVCFYKLADAALRARPQRRTIVTDRANFPTDRYVIESLAAQHHREIVWTEPGEISTVLNDDTALVTFSHIDYRSAAVTDMAAVTAQAHDAGALVLWDLSHSVGVYPVQLDGADADLAVGCTYKYLNGGPGSPAFLYVADRLQPQLRQPIWGWLGRRDPFAMGPGYEPAPGITQMISGTPAVLGLTAAAVGIDLSVEAGIDAIRAKSVALTASAVVLADEIEEIGLASPREPDRRGGHVSITHPAARALVRRLAERDVIADFREPDVIRLGLSPLTTRFTDVHDALEALRELLGDPEP